MWLAKYVTEKSLLTFGHQNRNKIPNKFSFVIVARGWRLVSSYHLSPRPPSQFLEFKWNEVKIKAELGCGTFGSVYLVKYDKEDRRNVIVKKMKGESAEAKRRFEKEAGILNSVKGHRNVSEFLRFCKEPYAIMMEHACIQVWKKVRKKVWKTVTLLEKYFRLSTLSLDFEVLMRPN